MRIREFTAELWLPQPPDRIFPFFSDPANLDLLTPPWLNLRTITPGPVVMREGALIDYQLRVRGLPMKWRTRINVWEPQRRFVDEQLRGPYRMWIHEHTFQPHNGGTLTRDHVRFAVPLDLLAHRWFVRPDIERIFQFRCAALQKRFASPSTGIK